MYHWIREYRYSGATCTVGLVQSGLHHRHQHFIEYYTFIACWWGKYENLFTQEYHFSWGQRPRGIWYSWVNNKRSLHDIFHIGPGISPRLPYQARQRSWRADMGRGFIPGTIWKISCHNLFITYFTLTFSKHWLLYCKKDLWTDKLWK